VSVITPPLGPYGREAAAYVQCRKAKGRRGRVTTASKLPATRSNPGGWKGLEAEMDLGRIEQLDLKSMGIHEEHDFTPWMLQNLDLLGRELGIDISEENRQREVMVGRYFVDICAEEAGTERKIIIENQLTPSNHGHLGQLLTYASGLDGAIVVWVCSQLRDEHRQALDWLNGLGGRKAAFFGVEYECIRIDSSRPAVRFIPIVRPAEWESLPAEDADHPGTGRYRTFFQPLVDEMREKHRFTNMRVAREHNWCTFAAGHGGLKYGAVFKGPNRLGVQLYIPRFRNSDPSVSQAVYDILAASRADIEAKLQTTLEWDDGTNRNAQSIVLYRDCALDDPNTYAELRSWAIDWLLKFKQVFGPYLASAVAEAREQI